MPATLRSMTAVKFNVLTLLSRSERRCFAGIDANIDNIKIFPDAESQFLQCLDQSIVDGCAQHRAMVIAEDEQRWSVSKLVSESKGCAVRITKDQIGGDFLPDSLLETDL